MAFHSFFFFLLALVFLRCPTSHSLPFVFIHGIGDDCSTEKSTHIVNLLQKASGVEGQCIEINKCQLEDIFVPLETQIAQVCEKVKELEHLKGGFNIFAVSQGTLIARGLIEFCDGAPPVKNFISLAGPHAGVGDIPSFVCEQLLHMSCMVVKPIFNQFVYTESLQNVLTPATFYKLPNKIDDYLKNSIFLPRINNERPEARNNTYKERFSSLDNLVLLMNENDTLLIPKNTSWFGYFKDETDKVINANETDLYKEDWIGLRTLDEAKKVKFLTIKGGHADLSDDDALEYVVPYLKDEPSKLVWWN